jgi:hypothetical protein
VNKLVRMLGTPVVALAIAASTLVVLAPSATAEVIRNQGVVCQEGSNATRCGWVNLDATNNLVRAYGNVADKPGGANADVWLRTCLQYFDLVDGSTQTGWCAEARGADKAEARTSTYFCRNSRMYRAVVDWRWGNEPQYKFVSNWVKPNVC